MKEKLKRITFLFLTSLPSLVITFFLGINSGIVSFILSYLMVGTLIWVVTECEYPLWKILLLWGPCIMSEKLLNKIF